MMPLTQFAFIIKAPGYTSQSHTAQLDSRSFSTRIIGVSDVSEANAVLKQLVAQGVQLVELCGGFTAHEAASLRAHIGDAIPIGVVTYSAEQQARLATLFA
jgi:Family of unknown function (DUF6506)